MSVWAVVFTLAAALVASVVGWVRAALKARDASALVRSATELAHRMETRRVNESWAAAHARIADADARAQEETRRDAADHDLATHLRDLGKP